MIDVNALDLIKLFTNRRGTQKRIKTFKDIYFLTESTTEAMTENEKLDKLLSQCGNNFCSNCCIT